MQKKIIKNVEKIIYYVVPIGLIVIYLLTIFNNSIWLDEAFSMSMIQQNFWEMICNTAIDVHPPLYYLILKVFVWIFQAFLGNSIWSAKLVSIIPIIILMVVSNTIIKKMYSKKTAFIFQILILTVPQIMNYAIEIRMYTYGLLFVTMFYLYCIKWKRENKRIDIVLMTVFAMLAAYTHYFALVPVAGIYIYILIDTLVNKDKKQIKELLLSILICCIVYLPWIIIWFKQVMTVKENYWISEITLEAFKMYFRFPFIIENNKILTYVLEGIFILSVGILFAKRKDKESRYYLLGILVPIGTIMVGVIASKILRPVFINRYIVCSLGVLWLAVAILLTKYCNKKYIFSILAIVILIVGSVNTYYIVKIEQQYKQEIDKTLAYTDTISGDIFVFDDNQIHRVIAYYYPKTNTYLYNSEITDLTKQVYRQTNMDLIENLEDIKDMNQDVYVFVTDDKTLDELTSLGYQYKEKGTYKIEYYTFSIYQING